MGRREGVGRARENNDNITNLFRLGPRGVTHSGLLFVLIAVRIAARFQGVLSCWTKCIITIRSDNVHPFNPAVFFFG